MNTKDAIRILTALSESPDFKKAVKEACRMGAEAIKKTEQMKGEHTNA